MIAFQITINGNRYQPIADVTALTMVSEARGGRRLDDHDDQVHRRRGPERVSLVVSGDPDEVIRAIDSVTGFNL
jgi:hypothetical protein